MDACRAAVFLLVACLPGIGGCSSSSGSDELRHYGPKVNLAHFISNTAAYKGKSFTLWLKVDEAIDRNQGQSLQDCVGREVRFGTVAPTGERLSLVVSIPEGLVVPDVGYGDEVGVTFICKRGSLRQGNEALSIEAP